MPLASEFVKHAKALSLGTPTITRYTVVCHYRPPKDHWPVDGPHWRTVTVVMDHTGNAEGAACDACLYLIATRRGQAKAISVSGGDAGVVRTLAGIYFNWNWYSGVVTWGGWVVGVR